MRRPSRKKVLQDLENLHLAQAVTPVCSSDCGWCEDRIERIARYFGFKLVQL